MESLGWIEKKGGGSDAVEGTGQLLTNVCRFPHPTEDNLLFVGDGRFDFFDKGDKGFVELPAGCLKGFSFDENALSSFFQNGLGIPIHLS